MKSRLLLTAGAGLILSGCSVMPNWFGDGDPEVDLAYSPGLDTALAADAATGTVSGPEREVATETASLSSAPSSTGGGRFEPGFGRNDGSIGSATASAKGPGIGGISR